jgi:hypothetical protein
MPHDDWHAFSMDVWGIYVTTWQPSSERAESLPAPLEFEVLHDGLVELGTGQRHTLLQNISCFQVGDPVLL